MLFEVIAHRSRTPVPYPLGGLALVLTLGLTGCGPAAPPEPEPEPDASFEHPLLLLAVDGLEWEVLLPLVRAGELPHLAALMARGSFGKLKSHVPTSSPVIWTSIATGKGPREHGIEGFVHEVPVDGALATRVYTSGDRRTRAFWNILDAARLPVDVIGWWVTYPAERVRGSMVSQTNTTAGFEADAESRLLKGTLQRDVPGQVWPPAREAEVYATLEGIDGRLDELFLEHYGIDAAPAQGIEARLWADSAWAVRADETYLALALERLRRGPPSAVTAVYLGVPDVVGHRFWRHAYPGEFEFPPAPEACERWGHLLDAAYRRVDRALGELLAVSPEDTIVFVASDHGMHAVQRDGTFTDAEGDPMKLLSGAHLDAPPGVFIAAGPGLRSADLDAGDLAALEASALERVGSVFDLTPTLLHLFDLPVGDDMAGRVLEGILEQELLERRPVRSIPSHDTPAWRAAQESLRVDQRDLTERLEQLRRLGYVR